MASLVARPSREAELAERDLSLQASFLSNAAQFFGVLNQELQYFRQRAWPIGDPSSNSPILEGKRETAIGLLAIVCDAGEGVLLLQDDGLLPNRALQPRRNLRNDDVPYPLRPRLLPRTGWTPGPRFPPGASLIPVTLASEPGVGKLRSVLGYPPYGESKCPKLFRGTMSGWRSFGSDAV